MVIRLVSGGELISRFSCASEQGSTAISLSDEGRFAGISLKLTKHHPPQGGLGVGLR